MLKLTPRQESLHKVLHQLHLSSVNNAEMGFKWCFHPILTQEWNCFQTTTGEGVRLLMYSQGSLYKVHTLWYNFFSSTGARVLHVTGTSQTQCPSCQWSFLICTLQLSTQAEKVMQAEFCTHKNLMCACRERTPGQTAWVWEELS